MLTPPTEQVNKRAGSAVRRVLEMNAREVHAVLDALAAAECPAWIGGGRGVDALLGHQSRDRADLALLRRLTHQRQADAGQVSR